MCSCETKVSSTAMESALRRQSSSAATKMYSSAGQKARGADADCLEMSADVQMAGIMPGC